MTEKTFTIVGVSFYQKSWKFRLANNKLEDRKKVLERGGHTDVLLVELPSPMTKMAAIEEFKKMHPEHANVRMPNDQPEGVKTVKVIKEKAKDPAATVLSETEETMAVDASAETAVASTETEVVA